MEIDGILCGIILAYDPIWDVGQNHFSLMVCYVASSKSRGFLMVHKEENQNSAKFGYAYIEAGVVGCFSRDDLIIEMKFSETGKVATNIVRDKIMQTIFLERTEVEDFLLRILEAAQKPEVLTDTRSTTWYYAKARWQNLGFVAGGLLGSVDVKSSEFPKEEIERLLADFKDTAKIQEVRKTLAKGLHRRAIEIHREVEVFAKAKSYLERSCE